MQQRPASPLLLLDDRRFPAAVPETLLLDAGRFPARRPDALLLAAAALNEAAPRHDALVP